MKLFPLTPTKSLKRDFVRIDTVVLRDCLLYGTKAPKPDSPEEKRQLWDSVFD